MFCFSILDFVLKMCKFETFQTHPHHNIYISIRLIEIRGWFRKVILRKNKDLIVRRVIKNSLRSMQIVGPSRSEKRRLWATRRCGSSGVLCSDFSFSSCVLRTRPIVTSVCVSLPVATKRSFPLWSGTNLPVSPSLTASPPISIRAAQVPEK